LFRELPDAFIGMEFGRITRKAVEVEPRIAGQERANRIAAMNRAIVPDHDHGAAQVAEEITEEGAYRRLIEVLG